MRVLLVEDDDILRMVIGRALREIMNLEVVTVSNSDSAINLLSHDGERFDVLITDVSLPGMNGCRLCRISKERVPRLKVLLLTGYHPSDLVDPACRGLPVLQKPFDLKGLRNRLYELGVA